MKKFLSFMCLVCLILSSFSFTAFAQEHQTIEFDGKTYINVDSKAVLDSLIYDMIEKREEKLDVYCYHDKRDWEDAYPRDIRNFIGYGTQAIFDYYTYTVGSTSLYTYPKYTDSGFTEEAYGTIEIRYLDTKEETAKADAIIDKVLAEISSMSLYEKLRYIADYVCKCAEYGSVKIDGGYDMINGAYDVLTGYRTNTVCTSYAVTFQRFMERLGVPALMTSNDNHIWNMVELEGLWYGIDCTSDAGEKINDSAFLMGKDSLARYPAGKLDPVGTFAKEHKISKTDYGVASKPAQTPVTSAPTSNVTSKKPSNNMSSQKPISPSTSSSAPSSQTESETNSVPETENKVENLITDITKDSIVKADVFKEAAKNNVNVELKSDKFKWSFDAKDLVGLGEVSDFDSKIFLGEDVEKEDIETIKSAAQNENIYPFSFAHHGPLPVKAAVSIEVSSEFCGKTVNIYSLDENKQAVLEATKKVSDEGVLSFETTHCSLWFVSLPKEASKNSMIWLYALIFIVLVAATVVLFVKRKNKFEA